MSKQKTPLWQQIYTNRNGLDYALDNSNLEIVIEEVIKEILPNLDNVNLRADGEVFEDGKAKISICNTYENDRTYVFDVIFPVYTSDGNIKVAINPSQTLPCGRMIEDYIAQTGEKRRKIKFFKVGIERGVKAIASSIWKYFSEYADMYDEGFANKKEAASKINSAKKDIESLAEITQNELDESGMSFSFYSENKFKYGYVKVVNTEPKQFKLEYYTTEIQEIGRAMMNIAVNDESLTTVISSTMERSKEPEIYSDEEEDLEDDLENEETE